MELLKSATLMLADGVEAARRVSVSEKAKRICPRELDRPAAGPHRHAVEEKVVIRNVMQFGRVYRASCHRRSIHGSNSPSEPFGQLAPQAYRRRLFVPPY